ncbi:MAG: nucleotidyltransferase domain-containing protein [Candidatus Hodarchaeota archaeon]
MNSKLRGYIGDYIMTKESLSIGIERIKKVEGFDKVEFIILYGSAARGLMRESSDIDLCIYYDAPPEEASRFRLKVLSELFDDKYDVQIFQQLPLYVRRDVLKGEPVYCKDTVFLYEVAIRTIRDFEEYKHRFYDYIGEGVIA